MRLRIIMCFCALALLIHPAPCLDAFEVQKTMTVTRDMLTDTTDRLSLYFTLAGAKITVGPPTDNQSVLIQATVTYDSSETEPSLTVDNGTGTEFTAMFLSGIDIEDYEDVAAIEQWHISFGSSDIATRLFISGGGIEGNLQLGGLPLEELSLSAGGADLDFDFPAPTTRAVQSISVEGGGITLSMLHLGNTDFSQFQLIGGGYVAELDFSGTYSAGTHAVEMIGAGNIMNIRVPPDAGEKIELLSVACPVFIRGAVWTTQNRNFFLREYITADYDQQDAHIDFDITAVGSLLRISRQ